MTQPLPRALSLREEQAIVAVRTGKLRIAIALLRLQIEIDDETAYSSSRRPCEADGPGELCKRCASPDHHEDNHPGSAPLTLVPPPAPEAPISHAPTTCVHPVKDGLAGQPGVCGEVIRWVPPGRDSAGIPTGGAWTHVIDRFVGDTLAHEAMPGPIAAPTLAPWR